MNNNRKIVIIYNLKYKDGFLTHKLTYFELIKTDIITCLKIYMYMNDKNMNYTWLLVQLKFMYNGIYTTSKAP